MTIGTVVVNTYGKLWGDRENLESDVSGYSDNKVTFIVKNSGKKPALIAQVARLVNQDIEQVVIMTIENSMDKDKTLKIEPGEIREMSANLPDIYSFTEDSIKQCNLVLTIYHHDDTARYQPTPFNCDVTKL